MIGAGEMGDETLRYLQDAGARDVTIVNRSPERPAMPPTLARPRGQLGRPAHAAVRADLVISTTGAGRPIVTLADFQRIEVARFQRPLFILDLAVPRDFDPAIGDCIGVYLYSIDDLQTACRQKPPRARQGAARRDPHRRAGNQPLHDRLAPPREAPIIKRLRDGWQQPKDDELRRLFNKLPELDERSCAEIVQSFDRLVNKLLHPPLESLRNEAENGPPHKLIDAFKRLFQLKD